MIVQEEEFAIIQLVTVKLVGLEQIVQLVLALINVQEMENAWTLHAFVIMDIWEKIAH